ncbi:MAG: hypothetical protein WC812_00190 [Candidatus Pacearchaeota archaeon]|jgi:hypothetical protein
MTNAQPRIERATIKLWVPHNDKEIAFIYPAVGPNTYLNVGKVILGKGMNVPTGDETASLLYSAYCSELTNESEFQDVKNIMEKNWLWVYNQDLWTDKGVFVVKDLKSLGISPFLNVNELEKKILKENNAREIKGIKFSEDGLVRFAPKGSYTLRKVSSEDFVKNGFIIASCGEKGAEKLGEVSTKFKNKPYIYGLNIEEGKSHEQRISAVSESGDGFNFSGYGCGGDYRCRALGYAQTNYSLIQQ